MASHARGFIADPSLNSKEQSALSEALQAIGFEWSRIKPLGDGVFDIMISRQDDRVCRSAAVKRRIAREAERHQDYIHAGRVWVRTVEAARILGTNECNLTPYSHRLAHLCVKVGRGCARRSGGILYWDKASMEAVAAAPKPPGLGVASRIEAIVGKKQSWSQTVQVVPELRE